MCKYYMTIEVCPLHTNNLKDATGIGQDSGGVEFFTSMTHLEEYNRIIEFRKANPLPEGQYGEKHHIKPKSIYPELVDDKDNIVRLSASEHFLVHYHIWKYYCDELKDKTKARKMMYAFFMMKRAMTKCEDVELMAKLYEEVKVALSQYMKKKNKGKHLSEKTKQKIAKSLKGKPSGMKGKLHSKKTKLKISQANKGRELSTDHRRKLSEALSGENNHNYQMPAWNKGKSPSEKTKQKLSKSIKRLHWFNNGVKDVRAKECPIGYKAGRISYKNKTK